MGVMILQILRAVIAKNANDGDVLVFLLDTGEVMDIKVQFEVYLLLK